MKPIVDRTMALVGMLLLIGIGVYLVGNWEQLANRACCFRTGSRPGTRYGLAASLGR